VGDVVFYAGDVGRAGSNAEYQLVDERIVGFAPKNIDHAHAAALPLTAITAYEMLFDRLMIDAQNKYSSAKPVLLTTGAAGGVGSIMIQLAKALCPQATVIATASREISQAWCKKMGADHVINHHNGIQNELGKLGIKEVSHIASLTHTSQHFDDYIELIKPQGKICLIDDPATPLNIQALKMKSVSLHWELMFTRARFETDDMIKQHHILNEVAQLIDAGKLQSTLTENLGAMNASNLMKAHEKMEHGNMIGKLVLEVK
jgi:NADPH2:quinone reductase